ncbi:MAG: hypothetical protein CFH16_00619 [Alphaproteobacteria bacterium MarineAlpha5_Bin6]|nr:MAG: hypothetical protein CFH17_01288 [Alphaproteobacteria bacterium MarineAlpha5_Bin7]PPR54115.1 MAG: hypothetical protein CFH16_00619 [Alphaproteobacteria bacterium MarineAlpha5_Bin6]|tara:strand:- start:1019 stop:1456 length:438 start_codon:yes stop_codon:yes gene_type:complete
MIKIDLINFTPLSSFIGGLLIGLAVIIFFISTGRLVGVSGIANNLLTRSSNRLINALFVLGLILGPLIFMFFSKNPIPFIVTNSIPIIIIGGLLVGIGTKIGSGCTSGHGVSGISRLSIRSIIATMLFICSAIITVLLFSYVGLN